MTPCEICDADTTQDGGWTCDAGVCCLKCWEEYSADFWWEKVESESESK